MSTNKWWGYIHINGNVQVKRYFDKKDIEEAKESPFCKEVFSPFEAENRNKAIEYIQEELC